MDKKIAVVTGSNRGIGFAIAEKLAETGCFVILSDIAESAEASLSKLRAVGDGDYKKCDISSREDRAALLSYIIEKYGRVDILVNNAGVAPLVREDLLSASEESFDRVLNINLKGTYFMSQLFAKKMVELLDAGLSDFRPRIVNISSVSAYTSSPARGEYCISKAGIAMTTKLFADRLAEHGIPVFEVRPGIIKTDMTAAVEDKYQKMIDQGVTPIKRFGLPADVANAVAAACTGLLDFSSGQVLNADGGFALRRL